MWWWMFKQPQGRSSVLFGASKNKRSNIFHFMFENLAFYRNKSVSKLLLKRKKDVVTEM